jgi:hypothetical protein
MNRSTKASTVSPMAGLTVQTKPPNGRQINAVTGAPWY